MTRLILPEIANRLALFSDTPELDASVLLAQITGKPRTWVIAHPEFALTTDQEKDLAQALKRLQDGEAFPYVLGHWEFFGINLDITPDVLIPRPETETLVEKAISWLQTSPERKTVADVGTGSGAIAISIALHVPNARIVATDISSAALEVAKHNTRKHNVQDQIEFIEYDLLPESNVKGNTLSLSKKQTSNLRPLTFDLICANLPYIPTETLHQLPIYGHEPTLALDGGKDGLDLYRRLLQLAPGWLAPRGMILLEIEAAHSTQALSLACDSFADVNIHMHQDLAGRDRLLEIQIQG